MHPLYLIEGTTNIDPEQLYGIEYNDPEYYPEFQNKIAFIKNIIQEKLDKKEGYVILRVYDGEFHFLNCRVVGNGPRRHFSRPLTPEFVEKFREGCYRVDLISVQLNINMIGQYDNIFPDRPMDFPMDIIYGLVANRWLFKTFKNRIALIGGEEKMTIIRNLMSHDEYQKYIGCDYFTDYIEVPERFSCDNTDALVAAIGSQIKQSKADVFLFGIGIAKMAIAWQFKNYKDAVFIDIGCGMSALAGTCGIDRPYFGGWKNYRITNYDYGKMDAMDFNVNNGNVVIL